MRKKKKTCYNNQICNNVNYCVEEAPKKQCVCSTKEPICEPKKCEPCECNVKNCVPDKNVEKIESCKPTKCKPKIKEYPCPCDCEIKFEDKCVDLAKRAEELFEKAIKYENKAICAFDEAKKYEENAVCLSQKSCNLFQNAKDADKASKNASCSAQNLVKKSEELCNQAKCLYKEASQIEKEAKENCENAKCAYEKAENYNAQAKYLYKQALEYDEKALKCYKSVGEKIKEYEAKSKKCEELMNKCGDKLNSFMGNIEGNCECEDKYLTNYNSCQVNNCGCINNECDEEIMYVENTYSDNQNCSYVNPIYDMTPMQYMGGISSQYINMESPYIMTCEELENVNDMWNNYYMYMQNMIKSMKY